MTKFSIEIYGSTKRQTGTAEILERDFQMQLGRDGYKLRVIESAHYAPGTIIYAYPWSVAR